ncbi:MAG TPA: hypothetical protein VIW19_13385 [Gaiellaceae bacterium]|jgi:uncharacterized membrane protein YgcG
MARAFVVALVALAGLLCAAAIGYAAYAVSRDSVAVPVTRLQTTPSGLTPAKVKRNRPQKRTTSTATVTGDDHGGGSGHSGHGGGGGGHGGDD